LSENRQVDNCLYGRVLDHPSSVDWIQGILIKDFDLVGGLLKFVVALRSTGIHFAQLGVLSHGFAEIR